LMRTTDIDEFVGGVLTPLITAKMLIMLHC
jgi:hypothetical protein